MGAADGESEIFAPGLMSGQVALVTGGGTGLGKASALELARCGANVVISGRRDQVLGEAAKEIGERCGGAERSRAGERSGAAERGGQADWVAGDVRTPRGAEALVRATLARYGRLDVLVNNAGGQYFTPAELIAAKGWRAVWRLNVGGILNMAEAAFELAFGPAGAGNIVNITLSPHHGMPGMAHSGSARATGLEPVPRAWKAPVQPLTPRPQNDSAMLPAPYEPRSSRRDRRSRPLHGANRPGQLLPTRRPLSPTCAPPSAPPLTRRPARPVARARTSCPGPRRGSRSSR